MVKYYYRILQIHHARMRTHTHTHSHTHVAVQVTAIRWRPVPLAFIAGSGVIEINTHAGQPISPRFWMFSRIKKLLGRTETRTRDRMYCQTIRTVRDISRDVRTRIAICSLRTPTDRQTQTFKRRIIVKISNTSHTLMIFPSTGTWLVVNK